jgi:hypothetical protein
MGPPSYMGSVVDRNVVMRRVDYVWWNGEVEWHALCCCMPAGGGLINMLHMSRADLWQGCHLLFHSSKSVYTHTPLQPTNRRLTRVLFTPQNKCSRN